MAKKKRISRKQLLKEPDEFLTFTGRAIQFAGRNRKAISGALVGVLVLALAVAGFRYFSGLRERRAYAMFEQCRSSYLAELSSSEKTASREETVNKFERLIKEYPSATPTRLGLLLYGDLSYQTGNYDKAIELYEKARTAFVDEGALQTLIWNGLGYAHEARKDYKSAAEWFGKIAQGDGAFMRADAYYDLGRMLELLNEHDKAVEAYDKLMETRLNPSDFPMAQEKALRLRTTPEPSK